MVKFHKMSPKMIIKKLILWMVVANSTTFVFASSGKDWFDAPLKDCFEAIEKGKFKSQGSTTVMLAAPVEYVYTHKEDQKLFARGEIVTTHCGVAVQNYFYDEKEYSLNRVLRKYPKSDGTSYWCKELNANNYAFCEYTKHKNIKGVRPIY